MIAQSAGRELPVWLRDTERSLRHRTLTAIVPALPKALAINLGETSLVAEETMNQLAQIDLDAITAVDLQPTRIKVRAILHGLRGFDNGLAVALSFGAAS